MKGKSMQLYIFYMVGSLPGSVRTLATRVQRNRHLQCTFLSSLSTASPLASHLCPPFPLLPHALKVDPSSLGGKVMAGAIGTLDLGTGALGTLLDTHRAHDMPTWKPLGRIGLIRLLFRDGTHKDRVKVGRVGQGNLHRKFIVRGPFSLVDLFNLGHLEDSRQGQGPNGKSSRGWGGEIREVRMKKRREKERERVSEKSTTLVSIKTGMSLTL